VVTVLLVVLLVVVAWGGALVATGLVAMDRVPVAGLAPAGGGVTNVLVVGSDSRADLSEEQRRELTTGGDFGPVRTDTILLVQSRGSDVALLSFPRDLWVERCDGSSQRINTAVGLDGLGCLVTTVQRLSGIRLDHVVQVGFDGFVEVVDAVGGVEVCPPQPITDVDAGIDLAAGCQVLGGPDALGYVRVRKIDDDLQRIQRQQDFLGSLAAAVAQPSTVLVPTTALSTARALGGAVTTDTGLGPLTLLRLANAARGLAAGTAFRATVPTTPTTIDGAAVLLPTDEAEQVLGVFRDGTAVDLAGAGDDLPDREQVRVVVLNGARVGGLATRTSDALTGIGYDVVNVGNADQATRTTVQHPPALAGAATRLADDVEAALGVRPAIREGAEGQAVTLLLGTDLQP
jgi:LCP family protein required for cell wall assembly